MSHVPVDLTPTVGMLSELKILLAEDNIVNQKLAIGILEKLGHQVTVANNGAEALKQLEQRSFDLVLMDVQMPEMDGMAATRELRRRETKNHIPVVAMTAHAMKGDRERCLESGMDDYLCKPIRLRDVSDKLNELFTGEESTTRENEPPSQDAASPDVIVWSEALANVAGDHNLLSELVQVFLDDTPNLMMQAVEAARQDDAEALRAAVHKVKGSMLFLNPRDAIERAQEVEQLATNGNVEASRQAMHDLQMHFGTVCKCLQGFLVRNG
jgi:CheY-like chemotaxis protein